MSSEEGFFDLLYLGIFITLSRAFDLRFYSGGTAPPALVAEMAHAVKCFKHLLGIFSARFVLVLEGQPVAHSYFFHRLLAEFAAAAVIFARGVDEVNEAQQGKEKDSLGSNFKAIVENVFHTSHPDAVSYYSRCVDRPHKDFLWTGPKVQVIPRSKGLASAIFVMAVGEMLESPAHPIYVIDLDPKPKAIFVAMQPTVDHTGKRRHRAASLDLESEHQGKRQRQP